MNNNGVFYGNCSCDHTQKIVDTTDRSMRICEKCGAQITKLAVSFEAKVSVSADMSAKTKNKVGRIVRKIKSGSEYNYKLGRLVQRYQDSDITPGGLYRKKVSYIDQNGKEIIIKNQTELEAHHKPDRLKKPKNS
jgi:hypothetical protein